LGSWTVYSKQSVPYYTILFKKYADIHAGEAGNMVEHATMVWRLAEQANVLHEEDSPSDANIFNIFKDYFLY